MDSLGVDPIREIFTKFKDPFDILAFEQVNQKNKRTVEKYNVYRVWEQTVMPNDRLRMIATEIILNNTKLTDDHGELKFYNEKIQICNIKGGSMCILKNLRIIMGDLDDGDNFTITSDVGKFYYFDFSDFFNYGGILFIYKILLKCTDFELGYTGAVFENIDYYYQTRRDVEALMFPNDKFRILSLITTLYSFNQESRVPLVLFSKNGDRVDFDDARLIMHTAVNDPNVLLKILYAKFSEGYISKIDLFTGGIRIIKDHLVF